MNDLALSLDKTGYGIKETPYFRTFCDELATAGVCLTESAVACAAEVIKSAKPKKRGLAFEYLQQELRAREFDSLGFVMALGAQLSIDIPMMEDEEDGFGQNSPKHENFVYENLLTDFRWQLRQCGWPIDPNKTTQELEGNRSLVETAVFIMTTLQDQNLRKKAFGEMIHDLNLRATTLQDAGRKIEAREALEALGHAKKGTTHSLLTELSRERKIQINDFVKSTILALAEAIPMEDPVPSESGPRAKNL